MKRFFAAVTLAGLAFTLPAAALTVSRPQADMTLIAPVACSLKQCQARCSRDRPQDTSICVARRCGGCK